MGFTLIELIIVLAITAVLSGIILFSISQYISRGKDSNISANLAVLVTAGEAFYNSYGSYEGFCENSVVSNAVSQMPQRDGGFYCLVNELGNKWSACAEEFSNRSYAYCVDSRGVKKEICIQDCRSGIVECPQMRACE